jgi:UDP-glucose 4-epimerase
MNVLITGGSGFIGRNLTEQLSGKYSISSPTSRELNLLDADAVLAYFDRNAFDVVIHTATWNATANSPKDVSKVLENNLRMFFNIVRCDDSYGKMIHFGSGAEYDIHHWAPKMKEDYFDRHVPADDYGFSKYIMAKYAASHPKIYNLRLFGVFGKYEDWVIRFISNACCRAAWDLPITIRQNVYFDYLYIDDLIRITEWFILHDGGEKTYNVCTSTALDLHSLANKVLAISGKNLDIVIARQGFGKEYSGDNARLLGEIGTISFTPIDDSIRELYDWYSEHKQNIDRNKLLSNK